MMKEKAQGLIEEIKAKIAKLGTWIAAPMVDIWFQMSQPRSGSYVKIRRGMPNMPEICIGPNVTKKPINSSQNCHRASRSESIRPVTFGYQ